MVAQVCQLDVGEFIHTFGNLHIYNNHMDQVKELLSRKEFPLPKIELNPLITEIDDFTFDDFILIDYQAHPAIKAPVAV